MKISQLYTILYTAHNTALSGYIEELKEALPNYNIY